MGKTVGMGVEVKKTDLNALKKENAAISKSNLKLQAAYEKLSKSHSELRDKLTEAEAYAETADKTIAELKAKLAVPEKTGGGSNAGD